MERYATSSNPGRFSESLSGGREALLFALRHPGRNREAAFALLAADALLTLACEQALDVDDPEEVLLEILEGVTRVEVE